MRPMEHTAQVACIANTGLFLKGEEQAIEFMRGQDSRQLARSSHGDSRAHPRVRNQQTARQQPLAEAAKARGTSSDRRRGKSCCPLLFHKSDETVSINLV